MELDKKLAEWAGFKKFGWKNWDLWLKPNEEPPEKLSISGLYPNRYAIPNFTQSLDTCFKWLVPKVIGDAKYSVIITQNLAQSIGCVRPLQSGKQYDAVDNHRPALALCLAIEKLIDGEK